MIQQLIKNSMITLLSFKEQYINSTGESGSDSSEIIKHFESGVTESLNYIINIEGVSKTGQEEK